MDEGAWTVIQRRVDNTTDFYRDWNDYVEGFGEPDGNYWMGLEAMHQMTNSGDMELRVDLQKFDGSSAYATYTTFSVGDIRTKYRLSIGGYGGTIGSSDSMAHSNNRAFSTRDKDNDDSSGTHCSEVRHSGWWHGGCTNVNLNGQYFNEEMISNYHQIYWLYYTSGSTYLSLQHVSMKIRKRS
jgi:hypothetical protein